MEFLNNYRSKRNASRQKDLDNQAITAITLTDFSNKIFIAYNNTPLVPIEDNWTPQQILAKLEETRKSYINYKTTHFNS